MSDHNHSIDAEAIEALNKGLLAELDMALSRVKEREAHANHILLACASERASIEEKRKTIQQVTDLQLSYLARALPPPPPLPPIPTRPPEHTAAAPAQDATPRPGPFPPPPNAEMARSKMRARIGPQRYLILIDIQEHGPTTVEEVSERTGLTLKRVKDQVRSDISDGVLDEVSQSTNFTWGNSSNSIVSMLRLSNAGGDLLSRFVEYRAANNQALPTKEEALGQQVAEGMFQ
jgi:hypothetical protein